MAKHEDGEIITKEDVISELYDNGKLTDAEVEILKIENKIEIGGVEVDFSKLPGLNQYGFYFGKEYVCSNYLATYTEQNVKLVINENNGITIKSEGKDTFQEEIILYLYDWGNTLFAIASPLRYNQTYTGIGTFGSKCSAHVNSEGHDIYSFAIEQDILEYEQNSIKINDGAIILEFSEDGKSFDFNGQIFKIED